MKLDTTEKLSRAESSRINGAKSTGPRTPEGKQRSAYNRTTHGMRSSRVVLSNESHEIYNDLRSLFFDLFHPRDVLEEGCVSDMVNARWFIRRLESAAAANIEIAMADTRAQVESTYQNAGPAHQHAFAFRAIGEMKGYDALGRYEDRQHRNFDKSYRLLARHRGKQTALPSLETLLEAEQTISIDNFTPPNPQETEPDTQNCTLEPEIAPAPVPEVPEPAPEPIPITRMSPAVDKPAKPAKPEEPRNPNCIYEDDYVHLKPLFEALKGYPDLRSGIAKALKEYKARNKAPLAA